MTLLRTSFLNGIAVLVKMFTLLVINKLLAIFVGPTGYAIVGQFQNAIQMITTFSSGAINTGVTKYTAEHAHDASYLIRLWKTAGTIAATGSLISAVLILIFKNELSLYFLKDVNHSNVFVWFAGSLLFFVLNTLLLAILNGKKEIKTYVVANINGSLLALGLTAGLTYYWKLQGALIALAIYQSVAFIVTLFLCWKTSWFKLENLFGSVDIGIACNLFSYTLMAMTSAICIPLSHILIRSHLAEKLSLQAAGEWEAMWRLSTAYLMFVTSTLSVYYLPRISELKKREEILEELTKCFKLIFPLLLVGGSLLYLFRELVIKILFSAEFLEIDKLFAFQLMGDTIKIISWLLSFIMVAKSMTLAYIFSEIIFSFAFYFLTVALLPHYGLVATSIAHFLNYIGYFIFVLIVLRKKEVI